MHMFLHAQIVIVQMAEQVNGVWPPLRELWCYHLWMMEKDCDSIRYAS
jgi:hypothetical protein